MHCAAPGISAKPYEDNLRYFHVQIEGPQQSAYEGESRSAAAAAPRACHDVLQSSSANPPGCAPRACHALASPTAPSHRPSRPRKKSSLPWPSHSAPPPTAAMTRCARISLDWQVVSSSWSCSCQRNTPWHLPRYAHPRPIAPDYEPTLATPHEPVPRTQHAPAAANPKPRPSVGIRWWM